MDLRKPITISLNPTYLCNFRCEFCYLTKEQLADKTKLDLNRLDEMILEILEYNTIEHVDIYGGEVGLLSNMYLRDLDSRFHEPTINVITNLSKIHDYFLMDHVELSVSFDFEAREKYQEVLANIAKIGKDVSILVLASPKVMKQDIDRMIKILNGLKNIKSVEIKPYSTNQANMFECTDRDFEEFIKKWITSSIPKRFNFTNAQRIKDSLDGTYSAFSDNHVYITPTGKYGVLEFDSNDNEYFLEMDTFKEYIEWAKGEKLQIETNNICSICPYKGTCLTEHYRDVKSLDNSCNGFRFLLDWAKESQCLVNKNFP